MKLAVLFIGLGLLASCSKSDVKPAPPVPPPTIVDTTPVRKDSTEDVYVVGQTANQVGYFKNNQFIALATGSKPLGVDMAFSGTDIYVLGQINDSIGYWFNGQFTFLAMADSVAPLSIAVFDSEVYSLLQEQTGNWPGDLYQYSYMVSQLPSSNQSGLTSLFLLGGDVYVPGANNGIHSNAVYWLNGNAHQLPNLIYPGHAFALALDETDVYVVGSTYDFADSTEIATFWKNDVPNYLSDSSSFSRIYFISISNGDTYMAGLQTGNHMQNSGPVSAVVWKNGMATHLTQNGVSDSIQGFAVNGSDVYVSVISNPIGTSSYIPRYYKNGIAVNYTGDIAGSGSRIYVRPR